MGQCVEIMDEEVKCVTVNGASCEWFYLPEFSQSRGQFEVKCIDSSHLLTRARRKACKGGIKGLSNERWLKVARKKYTFDTNNGRGGYKS